MDLRFETSGSLQDAGQQVFIYVFVSPTYAQVEARKAEILREIRELLSASAKLQPTKVNIAWHFMFHMFHTGRGGQQVWRRPTL